MQLTNIIVPYPPPSNPPASTPSTHDITLTNSTINSITPHTHPPSTTESQKCPPPSLLLPTLTHPHIHLDKAYLLTSNSVHPLANPCSPPSPSSTHKLPDYGSLSPKSGEFGEALKLTSEAKGLYTEDDLYLRGKQLLMQSYRQGVTSARCFVEVDHVVGRKCVSVGRKLKLELEGQEGKKAKVMRLQLVAFAQDPIFSSEYGDENRRLMEEVLEGYVSDGTIEVLGTTPYVETSVEAARKNIDWAVKMALRYVIHLDFHLDYNLKPSVTGNPGELRVWDVLRLLKENNWPTRQQRTARGEKEVKDVKTVVLGHCTALTLLPHRDLLRLSHSIHNSALPIYFVGLPTSDIYMQGRPSSTRDADDATPLHRPRATLPITALSSEYGLDVVLGVNNVGNAFTPFGTGDPLELASWGVGLYFAGAEGDELKLYSAVSTAARRAIGLEPLTDSDGGGRGADVEAAVEEKGKYARDFEIREGMDISEFGLLLVRNEEEMSLEDIGVDMRVKARRRVGVRDVVWDVPEVRLRRVVR
jgi:cytosine/adenosine deaminase-related metal-dependent hydrolase